MTSPSNIEKIQKIILDNTDDTDLDFTFEETYLEQHKILRMFQQSH